MIIKKFQAKSENEAVESAKQELGPGVVIMNVKTVKKKGIFAFLKSPIVEVTVALEEESEKSLEPQKQRTPTMTALEQLALQKEKTQSPVGSETIDNGTNVIEEKLDSLQNLLKQKLESQEIKNGEKKEKVVDNNKEKQLETEPDNEEPNEQMKFVKILYNMMIDNEVHEKYANQIIEESEKNSKPNMPFDYLLTNIYQKMILKFGQPKTIEPASEGPKVVYFVGPTGVGKTTTIAKIASKFCVDEKKKVALLTADTYRIAAAEQLRTYANILEVPFRIIYSGQEILQAYEEFKDFDYILVDTAGHSHHNEEQKNSISQIIHSLDNKAESEVYLVLSSTTKYRDLTSIADTYHGMTTYKIIFTKLDETTSLGNLLNLRLYTNADLSYVTYGQNVPEDIDKFNPQTTVKQILGGKS